MNAQNLKLSRLGRELREVGLGLLRLGLLGLVLLGLGTASAQAMTPAGTLIRNQATAHYSENGELRSFLSNEVQTLVLAICDLSILPNGSVAGPAQTIIAALGNTVYFPYTLTNTGNAPHTYLLNVSVEEASSLQPLTTQIILDLNGNGQRDPGEPIIEQLTDLPADTTVNLLLEVTLPQEATDGAEIYLNLIGLCASDPTVRDNNNVVRVSVRVGNVSVLNKRAEPAAGAPLAPGAPLVYELTFDVNDVALQDVLLSDPLSPLLEDPLELQLWVDNVSRPETVRYDAPSRTVIVSLDTLPPFALLRLQITTRVRSDAPAGTISNQAVLRWRGGERVSEAVEHPLVVPERLADLVMRKSADVSETFPGLSFVYTLNVSNNGPESVSAARVSDSFPVGLTNITWTCTPSSGARCTPSGTGNIDDNVDLPAGSSLVYRATVTVGSAVVPGTSLRNVAVVSPPPGVTDPAPENNSSESVVTVRAAVAGVRDLLKAATPASGTLEPGADIVYRVSFSVNELPLTNVVLSDTLHPALEAPTALELTVNGVPQAASVSYDTPTRTVRVNLARLERASTVVLTIQTRVRLEAEVGTVVSNRALLRWDGGEAETNETRHELATTCRLEILPDGSLAAPGQTAFGEPGGTVVLPYSLRNPDGQTHRYTLRGSFLSGNFTPAVATFLDVNGNGQRDPEDREVTELELAGNSTAALLLVVTVPEGDATFSGEAFVNLVGACLVNPAERDDNNVSLVRVLAGGLLPGSFQKVGEPAGSIFPNGDLAYEIRFSAAERDLFDVVVSDTLDTLLDAPRSFTSGTLSDPDSGLSAEVSATYDAATRTVRWSIPRVPAGMTVRLRLETSVRADAPLNATIENRACISFRGSAQRCSEPVETVVETLELLLTKESAPTTVGVGDTLRYTITIINPSPRLTLTELELVDALPAGLRYLPGTSTLTLAEGTSAPFEPLETEPLRWTLPPLEPQARLVVTFDTQVLASVLFEERLTNTATVSARNRDGELVAQASDNAVTVIDRSLIDQRAVLLGTAFIDNDGDGILSEGDTPVEGLRLYLPTGVATITDRLGRYVFLDLPSGVTSLKVDLITTPSRALLPTATEEAPGLWRLRLYPGLIVRQDVPFIPARIGLRVAETLELSRGGVTMTKTLTETGGLTRVNVTLSASEGVRGLTVSETLPEGVLLSEARFEDGTPVISDGTTFSFGDLTAGTTLRYSYRLPQAVPLTSPTITWELR